MSTYLAAGGMFLLMSGSVACESAKGHYWNFDPNFVACTRKCPKEMAEPARRVTSKGDANPVNPQALMTAVLVAHFLCARR